jgi:predicted signal transduction protein with EAL and GGDEF domain
MTGDLGCTHIQGYHLSRPLPAAVFRDWAAKALESHTGGTHKVTPITPRPRRAVGA